MDGNNVVPMHRDGIGVVHEDEMDFNPETGVDFIEIGGGGLSQFGVSSLYGLMWKVATVVIFWKAAFWAIEGSIAEEITNKIKSGGEAVGKYTATMMADNVRMPLGKGEGLTLANIGNLPGAMANAQRTTVTENFRKWQEAHPDLFPGIAGRNAQARAYETDLGKISGDNAAAFKETAEATRRAGYDAVTLVGAQKTAWEKFIQPGKFSAFEKAMKDAENETEKRNAIRTHVRSDLAGDVDRLFADVKMKGEDITGGGGTEEGTIHIKGEEFVRFDVNPIQENASAFLSASPEELAARLDQSLLTFEEHKKAGTDKVYEAIKGQIETTLGRTLTTSEGTTLKTNLKEAFAKQKTAAKKTEKKGTATEEESMEK